MIGEVKLKPCPFCGGNAFFNSWELPERERYKANGHVMCRDCQAAVGSTGFSETREEAEQKAVVSWNRRAPEPGTSVIRWTRYDGTPETLPGQQKSVLLRLSGGDNTRIAYWFGTSYMWHLEGGSVSKIRDGDLWAYLTEPPEVMK